MGLKEDVLEMKQEVNEVKEQSLAMELIADYKKQNKRLFIIWIITFITLIGMVCYTIYLLNDIGTITTEQEIKGIDNITNSNINNGGGN